MTLEEGERLREFLRRATGGSHGWVSDLARQAGLRRGTLYSWFEGRATPTLDALGELARVTGTSRAEMLAAMDGRPGDPLEERVEALERAVTELLRTNPPAPGGAAPPAPRARRGSAG